MRGDLRGIGRGISGHVGEQRWLWWTVLPGWPLSSNSGIFVATRWLAGTLLMSCMWLCRIGSDLMVRI